MRDYEQKHAGQEADRHITEKAHQLGHASLGGEVELQQNMETDQESFSVTVPESRTYSPYENYRFLVHVAKDSVAERAGEIGKPRNNGVLMASLVSNTRPATFLGEGGIILAEPPRELVTDIAAFDVGGENKNSTKVAISELLAPRTNSDYNQIDMRFESTSPIGVMIKRAATDGHELGNSNNNASLRAYAEQHHLPVVETLILPDALPAELSAHWEQMDDGNKLLTADIPDTKEQYYRVQVLHGRAYGMPEGADTMARVMKISAYGEAPQELSSEERQKALSGLTQLLTVPGSGVTQNDINTVVRDLADLEKKRKQQ